MVSAIQIFLNRILDVEHPASTVTALNYFNCPGEQFIQMERGEGHKGVIILISDTDTLGDIRDKVTSHPAYY